MISLKRRAFTLLEIAIALMILSLISGLVLIQGKKLIDHYRFENEIAQLFLTLQEAQVLASTFQTDIALDFSFQNGVLSCAFSSDEPFTAKQFQLRSFPLAHIARIAFKDRERKQLHFDLFSDGRIEPRGILAFYPSKDKNHQACRWFDLQYGHLIKCCYLKPTPFKQPIPPKPENCDKLIKKGGG